MLLEFIRANTALAAVPFVPEISLFQAAEPIELWEKTEESGVEQPPPFWAFAWAGGQALARHLVQAGWLTVYQARHLFDGHATRLFFDHYCIVDRLGEAFDGFRQSGAMLASNVHFITGPSRTSDIENDLSIGVHGPAAVSVIVWRDDAAKSPKRGTAKGAARPS